ncbi:MAG: cytochrome P450 [Pseudonocardiaceae bacterium]
MTTKCAAGTAPGALPLLGHALPLLRNPLRFLASLPDRGDLVGIRIGPIKAIVVCAPELIRQVLLNDHVFDKGGPIFDRSREGIGDALGVCPHSLHRRQRRLIQPTFHPTRLPGYAHVMTKLIAEMTGSWRDGQALDVLSEMMTLTSRTLMETMFSDALPAALFGEMLDDLTTVLAGIYKRMLMPPSLDKLPLFGNRRYDRALLRMREVIGRVITERRASGTDRGDLLSTLLSARDPADNQGLSDTEITDQVLFFFSAGTETTAATLAWAVHLLAQHPEIEHRLHAEVDAVLAGAPASCEDLPKLELTGRVVTETLRIYPPVWMLTRTTTTNTHLGGHPIPAGSTLVYSTYLLHHRPDLYPDPDRFDPDRWTNGHTPQPPRNALIPFGGGARKCIGDTFAITEATLALATITTRWRLRPLPGHHVHPALSVSLRPRGLRMRATTRKGLSSSY